MSRPRIGFFFGGQSPEHEVSVITAMQAAAALDSSRYESLGVYVAKDGTFHVGDGMLSIESFGDVPALLANAQEVSLRPGVGNTLVLQSTRSGFFGKPGTWTIDVAFLAFHGGAGEAGGMQGICEMAGVPYTGSGVMASAIGMDKVRSKLMCAASGVPVVDGLEILESAWAAGEEDALNQCEHKIGYPAIVKPVRLGSSIGIARADNRNQLDAAIEEAFRYDASVLVETCVPNLREINCSVLGDAHQCDVSLLEEPMMQDAILSYKDKYMRAGTSSKSAGKTGAAGMASLDRVIPAPLSEELTDRIQHYARTVFQALDCAGVVRIDFLMDDEKGSVFFNEINTIPGSLSFYLWKPTGVDFPDLVARLVEIGLNRFRDRNQRVRSYDVNLLAERAVSGLKGRKT